MNLKKRGPNLPNLWLQRFHNLVLLRHHLDTAIRKERINASDQVVPFVLRDQAVLVNQSISHNIYMFIDV